MCEHVYTCVSLCVSVRASVCVRVTCLSVSDSVPVHVCVPVCVCLHAHVCVSLCVILSVHTRVHVSVCVSVSLCVPLCACARVCVLLGACYCVHPCARLPLRACTRARVLLCVRITACAHARVRTALCVRYSVRVSYSSVCTSACPRARVGACAPHTRARTGRCVCAGGGGQRTRTRVFPPDPAVRRGTRDRVGVQGAARVRDTGCVGGRGRERPRVAPLRRGPLSPNPPRFPLLGRVVSVCPSVHPNPGRQRSTPCPAPVLGNPRQLGQRAWERSVPWPLRVAPSR